MPGYSPYWNLRGGQARHDQRSAMGAVKLQASQVCNTDSPSFFPVNILVSRMRSMLAMQAGSGQLVCYLSSPGLGGTIAQSAPQGGRDAPQPSRRAHIPTCEASPSSAAHPGRMLRTRDSSSHIQLSRSAGSYADRSAGAPAAAPDVSESNAASAASMPDFIAVCVPCARRQTPAICRIPGAPALGRTQPAPIPHQQPVCVPRGARCAADVCLQRHA